MRDIAIAYPVLSYKLSAIKFRYSNSRLRIMYDESVVRVRSDMQEAGYLMESKCCKGIHTATFLCGLKFEASRVIAYDSRRAMRYHLIT